MAKRSYCYTIRTLYGLAKSEEIGLTDELLHLLDDLFIDRFS